MTKLTDTQLIALTAAAGRDDGSILPLPKSIRGGAVNAVVESLIKKGLVERQACPRAGRRPDPWDDRPAVGDVFKITGAGLAAINADPGEGADTATDARESAAASSPPKTRKKAASRALGGDAGATIAEAPVPGRYREGTKQALLIEMLRRPEGATVDEVVGRTGWRRHTVRGAISGAIRKKLGLAVQSDKIDERGRVYRIVDAT